MDTYAIETHGLTKTFTRGKTALTAVDSLDLRITGGELIAFLGPNGAGKTTTLKMLTTLLRPTSGSMYLLGIDVEKHPGQARRRFGFVGQGNGAGHMQHGRDEVIGQAMAHGMGRREARRRTDELLEALDLTALADRPVSQLSGGQRRRVDIAIGLVNSPEVLFLDEPSTGLDPQNRAHLLELIRDLHKRTGATIVLTTHYLEEADSLSQRVVVIDHGQVIADDTAPRLKNRLGDLITLHLADPEAGTRVMDELSPRFDRLQRDASHVMIRTGDGARAALDLVDSLRLQGHRIEGIEIVRPSLDDVFLDLTGRSLREHAEVAA